MPAQPLRNPLKSIESRWWSPRPDITINKNFCHVLWQHCRNLWTKNFGRTLIDKRTCLYRTQVDDKSSGGWGRNLLKMFFKKLEHESECPSALNNFFGLTAMVVTKSKWVFAGLGVCGFCGQKRKRQKVGTTGSGVRIRNISLHADDDSRQAEDATKQALLHVAVPKTVVIAVAVAVAGGLLHTIVQLPNGHNSALTKN